jgi:hypothetical protein
LNSGPCTKHGIRFPHMKDDTGSSKQAMCDPASFYLLRSSNFEEGTCHLMWHCSLVGPAVLTLAAQEGHMGPSFGCRLCCSPLTIFIGLCSPIASFLPWTGSSG